jgi:hypothetical protein
LINGPDVDIVGTLPISVEAFMIAEFSPMINKN